MSNINSEFVALMARVRTGCPEASREVFVRFSDPVRRVVRRNLRHPLRRHYDSTDFEQSVWASFFDTSADRYSFANPDELVAFLSRIAYNKIVDTSRKRLGTQRYDIQREQSLDAPRGPNEDVSLADSLPAPTHTPSKYVMADERWQKLTGSLLPGHVRILELILEGHSNTEIVERIGGNRKVIERLVKRLQELAFPS